MLEDIKNIKYIINEKHIPIINIIPINNSNLSITVTFPLCYKKKSFKTSNINISNKATITQKILENKEVQLLFNEIILDIKKELYSDGFILIKGDCIIEETYYEMEKFD